MDIEPCFSCGGEQVSDEYHRLNGHRYSCVCGASGPFYRTRDQALVEWNRVAGQRWRLIETAPEDRRGLIIYVKPGGGATHWRPALEPPEPPPIETSGYYEVTGKEPLP